MPRRPLPLALLLALAFAASCGGNPPASTSAAPAAPVRPLAGLAGMPVVVTPVFSIREGDALGWAAQIPRQRTFMRALDDEIAFELKERGIADRWILPEKLEASFERNSVTSPDPYRLAAEPLRQGSPQTGARLTDPLASQLRTLVAVHDGRLVLLPVELSFEKMPSGMGRGVLRLVLADARTAEVRWIGQVKSDSSATFDRALPASLASHLADLVAAP